LRYPSDAHSLRRWPSARRSIDTIHLAEASTRNGTMQSTCRRTSAWRRTMTVAPGALVLSLAGLPPDCADDARERGHLAALVRQSELADRLANQLADQTAPYAATRDAGLAQVDSGGGYPFTHSFRFGPRVPRTAPDLLPIFYPKQTSIHNLPPHL